MLPKYHAFYGFIFSAILFILFPEITLLNTLIIWAASILIDVDHYFFYVVSKKDISLRNAHKWFIEKNKKFMKLSYKERLNLKDQIPCIFHGIEALIVLFILSYFSSTFFYIAIGFIFHEILDFIFLIYNGFTLKHLGSQTYNVLKYRKIN